VQHALADQRLELAFQPVVAVAGGEEPQFQTLLRMRAADGRVLAAGEFLPAAEAGDIIHEVDARALQRAADVLERRLREQRPVRLFVSQSVRTLAHGDHAARVVALLGRHAIPGPSLVIDLRLEDVLVHALAVREFCEAMVPAGVQICLSQFRPGEDATQLVAELPLGYVRLAGRYSARLEEAGVRDEMRVAIDQAHRRGLKVIGPQVEDPQAAATLWMSGVDYIQGNLVQQAAGEMDFDFGLSVL
jgi:EAL domain-containing protein (putative c-di-GMP-specific phosphodiesterase class I)